MRHFFQLSQFIPSPIFFSQLPKLFKERPNRPGRSSKVNLHSILMYDLAYNVLGYQTVRQGVGVVVDRT